MEYNNKQNKHMKKNTVLCAVLGTEQPIIQAQFEAKAARDGLTLEELTASYVTSKGKQHLTSLGLTKEEVAAQYPDIHPNILNKLRVFKKVRKNKSKTEVVVDTPVVDDTPVVVETVNAETPVDSASEDVMIQDS